MFECDCCVPKRSYSKRKSLYRHQRKHVENFTTPYDGASTQYKENPKKCRRCDQPIPYNRRQNKFCNSSCAAIFNNTKRFFSIRNSDDGEFKTTPLLKNCRYCGTVFRHRSKIFCDRTCMNNNKWQTYKARPDDAWTARGRKKYLLEKYGHCCMICDLTEWCGAPIPIELDHINGDFRDNSETNTRLICPNCHAQTPNYKSKNIGNGRFTRMERYRSNSSY